MLTPTRGQGVIVVPSPFAQAAPNLSALGYSCLPLVPSSVTRHRGRGKCPGVFRAGHWQALDGWEKRKDAPLSGFELSMAMSAPEANIGLILGTVARPGLYVIAIDLDITDADALDTLVRCMPLSPMVKKGSKGETHFYAAPKSVTSRSFDDHRILRESGMPRRLVDVLTGFNTKQTVCPPSVHPDGPTYEWLAGPVPAAELPVFDDDAMTVLEEALQEFGYDPDASRGGRGERKPYVPTEAGSDSDDPFETAKRAALADLGAWVFDVQNLGGLRPARGGFEAVNLRRSSSSGRPDAVRKRNLSIQQNGITDFGTGETWSAIDLVAEFNGVSVSEALSFLEERLGLNEDNGFAVDFSGMLASQQQRAVAIGSAGIPADVDHDRLAPAAADTAKQDDELPDHLTRVPGLVGQITDWIEATSRKPQRVLAMAAAIGIVGTVAGRKFAGPTDSATHLYILGIAKTGAGKNAPKKAGAALLTAAGLRPLLGPGGFMSSSGLIQHVSRNPASLCILDEFGVFLAKLNAKGNSTHERAISGDLRQLWSLSFEEFQPPKWAHSAQRQEMAPIISPALSIIGLSTPDEFYASLQGADIVSGFANRFLILATSKNPEDVEPTASVFDVPAQLIEGLQGIAGVGGALATATMHSLQADKPMVRVDWEGGVGSAAHNVFKRLKADIQSREGHEALMQRTAEMAVRLATIRAIGISGENAEVSADDMQWGADLALWSAERLIADVDAHMVESDHQMRAKLVLRIIKESPDRTIGRTALCRKVNHRFDARTLDAVILGLCDAGQVEELKECSGGRAGRKASGYRAVK
ncbi:MAG: hypothetical protein DCF29_10090 [Alphaproteobacteria bacterium]|nr:MAG: hypothetical protein DCF29_10090 [Alphaproteobacteria bacterium]